LKTSLSPELIRLISGQISLHAAMAGLRMAAPLWALSQGFSPAVVGIVVALFALSQVFLAIPVGRYADRVGLRKPFGLAVGIACAGAALVTAYPHFITLCIGAVTLGGAVGCSVIALQRHVGRATHNPLELRQAFSWLSIGPAAANFVGPFFCGVLIDTLGYRYAFGLCALLPLLGWLLVRKTPEQQLSGITAEEQKTQKAWDLLRDKPFRRLLVVNWLMSSCWDAHSFLIPVIGHERGYNASVIGTILGTFALAVSAIRVLIPMLAHSLREWAVIVLSMVMTAMLMAVYPLMPTALSMGVVSVFLGFTLGCIQPMIMSMLHQITPEERHGDAIALRMMAINISSVSMPVLFGSAGALIGTSMLFWGVAGLVGAGAYTARKLRTD
jgi:MFS family permease